MTNRVFTRRLHGQGCERPGAGIAVHPLAVTVPHANIRLLAQTVRYGTIGYQFRGGN